MDKNSQFVTGRERNLFIIKNKKGEKTMKRKLVFAVLIAAMTTMVVSGCGKKEETKSED